MLEGGWRVEGRLILRRADDWRCLLDVRENDLNRALGMPELPDLRSIAHALGGEVSGRNTISIPTPGHSRRDRGTTITFDSTATDGFLVHSFEEAVAAIDRVGEIDRAACREHVASHFTIDRMADRYLELYCRLLSG